MHETPIGTQDVVVTEIHGGNEQIKG